MLQQLCDSKKHKDRTQLISNLFNGCTTDNYRNEKVNLYKYLEYGKTETIVITCHHDIVNTDSDNCLDNNASIFNIIKLDEEIRLIKPNYNVILAIVDEEESGGGGIKRLIDCYEFDQHIDLELTALGQNVCYSPYGDYKLVEGLKYKPQPANNALMAYRYSNFIGKPYAGACITMLDNDQLCASRPANWGKIHTLNDRIQLANYDDMAMLRHTLLGLLES